MRVVRWGTHHVEERVVLCVLLILLTAWILLAPRVLARVLHLALEVALGAVEARYFALLLSLNGRAKLSKNRLLMMTASMLRI